MPKYTHEWNAAFVSNTKGMGGFELCLEIGCFEGLTSNYICNNLLEPNGRLICVDPLADEYITTDLTDRDEEYNKTIYSYFNDQYVRFSDNVKPLIDSGKLLLYRGTSDAVLPQLQDFTFDMIYIDGDHRKEAVYRDGCWAIKLIRSGGVIIFDDYDWADGEGRHVTREGIDRVLAENKEAISTTVSLGQVIVRKI
jgi:predicted O-methyltransferase YrrM